MFKHYLITILRNFSTNKHYTLINIIGLTTGMAVFLLIMLYVDYEFSFDQYHEKSDRIYRVIKQDRDNYYMGNNKFVVTPLPLAPALKREFPEVEYATRIYRGGNALMEANGQFFIENDYFAADPEIFDIFTISFTQGNKENPFTDKYSVIISESLAKKYFGTVRPFGETINYKGKQDFIVSGVIKDMPHNSHFRMNFIIPIESWLEIENFNQENEHWGNNSYFTYLLLEENADYKALEKKLRILREKYADDKINQEGGQETIYLIQPLKEIYLFTDAHFDIQLNSDGKNLYIFSTIAFLILLIACINYMNLATARSVKRAKEVGIRKTVGAYSNNLIIQFIGESLIISFLSLCIALLIIYLLLPGFNNFIEREISLNFLENGRLLLILVGTTFFVGLVSGSYPAFMLASYKPVKVLKGSFSRSSHGVLLRNLLVVFQFGISGILIISTLVITDQLSFITNKDMGYDREHIVVVRIRDNDLIKNIKTLKSKLKKHPEILSVSQTTSLPNNITSQTSGDWVNKPEDVRVPLYTAIADYEFADVFGLKIIDGRNFSKEVPSDERGAVLLNEAAAKAIGWDDPVGHEMIYSDDTIKVVGLLKDWHQHPLHLSIAPLQILMGDYRWKGNRLAIKTTGNDLEDTIWFIEEQVNDMGGRFPFEYSFFDEEFSRSYLEEQKTSKVIWVFMVVTIIIACLGLYGLALFSVQQKVKEIGIRKIMGASVLRIIILLSKSFVFLVIVSFVIAGPLAWLVMEDWLSEFAYHIELNWISFVITLVLMLVIGWLTVGYQTYKAAHTNPVNALREE